jgi:tRNA nucleotidyltransferase (CCA-adding enzyme)
MTNGPTDSLGDPLTEGLEVYQVGGSVRDALLGRPAGDRDFVVVGASPEIMAERGFRPVGKDFPVFLHPITQEEYALARTERKTAPGYHGFTFHTGPEVTLEDDLARRDLTINAIALSADGLLVDPYNGRLDLEQGRLRHVSEAFREDPVRVLRLARFATRFSEFSIAEPTLALCQQMVADGELSHLVPERVWQEMSRAMMHDQPSRFFSVLRDCGALAVVLPELDALFGVPQPEAQHPEVDTGVHSLMALDQAARLGGDVAVRFAALVHDLGKALTPRSDWPAHHGHEQLGLGPLAALCERLRVPNPCRQLAELVTQHHMRIHRCLEMRPATVVKLLEDLDAFRRPQRLPDIVLACEADARGRLGLADTDWPQGDGLKRAHASAAEVTAAPFVARGLSGPAIAEAIHAERVERVRQWVAQH